LLALQPGDQIRAAGDGEAVLCFTGGGIQAVSAANSPSPSGAHRRGRHGEGRGAHRPCHAVPPRPGKVADLSTSCRAEASPASYPCAAPDQTLAWDGDL
jgi:hypothetical protein